MLLALLFHYLMLNMFRTLIYPSSGACDYSVQLPHRSVFLVRRVLEIRCGWVGVVSVLQVSACNTDYPRWLFL